MSTRTPTSGAVRRTGANGAKQTRTALVQLRRRAAPAEVERIPLFSIDDTDYTMPAVVHAGDTINWSLVMANLRNEDAKGLYLLRMLCGEDAALALLGDSTMTQAEWGQIRQIMQDHAFGPTEATEGN